MKTLALLLSVLLISADIKADGVYLFGGIYAYDDKSVDIITLAQSPDGIYGVKYQHNISDKFYLDVGWKHQSSIPRKEAGQGREGFFTTINLKIY